MSTELVVLHPLLKLIKIEDYPQERALELWQKVREQDYAFDDTLKDDHNIFLAQLLMPNNLFFEIGDRQGLACVQAIYPKVSCILHFMVWDKLSLRELRKAGNSLLENLFSSYELNRVSAFIPAENVKAIHFAVILGFQEEGRMKGAFLHQGEYQDVHMFGLLRKRFDSLKEF